MFCRVFVEKDRQECIAIAAIADVQHHHENTWGSFGPRGFPGSTLHSQRLQLFTNFDVEILIDLLFCFFLEL